MKFYTEDGNWDLVGNNTPIFFIRDPLKFSDFIRTQKRDPGTHLKPHFRRWDYWSLSPEALHQVMFLYSDRGTPVSARFMNGYGSHTFSFWNEQGERTWVKFHFKTQQGSKNFTDDEAVKMTGDNADFSSQDFIEAIQKGDFPKWKLFIQGDAGEGRGDLQDPSVRSHQGLAARGLPAAGGRRDGAEPQRSELFRRGRAGQLRTVQRRAGHRLLAGQGVAEPGAVLFRRPPLSFGAARTTTRSRSTSPRPRST